MQADIAKQIVKEIQDLPVRRVPTVRVVRRKYSRVLRTADAQTVLKLAHTLLEDYGLRWVAYELIAAHPGAFHSLDEDELEALGQGINSWDTVDTFARTLSGPAWLSGFVSDEMIKRWARSEDLWWRRAALVSTVALNVRSHGGSGDVERTLAVCRMLVDDHEDMVVKAMSWALRQLTVHDPAAVRAFLKEYDSSLAARVKREVAHKLTTGLKYPRRGRGG